jgi:RNA polymerase sigma-70 factor (ECF subfamily)
MHQPPHADGQGGDGVHDIASGTPEEEQYNCLDLRELTEARLVDLAQQGDDGAFQELLRQVRESCLGIAASILHNREDAQDEVQNAFWKAYTHLKTFGRESTFSTWVTRIVINHCLMRYRRSRRVRFVSYESVGQEGEAYFIHEPPDPYTPEQGLGLSELHDVLRHELAHIPILLRIPLEMRYVSELPLEVMADRLGITVAATKSRLHRAQCYLKDRMLRHCGKRGAGTLVRAA